MPLKQAQRKTHRTMQGKQVDMDLLRKRNELTLAVGNQRVNARGDELGPNGKIVRKREAIMRDHYASQAGSVPDETKPRQTRGSLVESLPEGIDLDEKPKRTRTKKEQAVAETADAPTASELAEWEEDDDGNFVRK